MKTLGFEIQQSFQALRLNESAYGLVSPFGLFQDRDFRLAVVGEGSTLSASLSDQTGILGLPEHILKNLLPASPISERPRFKQPTFSGKPLSDEEITQANELAADLDDQGIISRLLGR